MLATGPLRWARPSGSARGRTLRGPHEAVSLKLAERNSPRCRGAVSWVAARLIETRTELVRTGLSGSKT